MEVLKTTGSRYTWWNGRTEGECIFKRLDRVLGNQALFNLIPSSEVHHLIRRGSDHAPLHVICNTEQEIMVKPFKFNFWTKYKDFYKVVEDNWKVDFNGCPFLILKINLKRVKCAFAKWSKVVFGDIFQQIATLEDVIKVQEIQFEMMPT